MAVYVLHKNWKLGLFCMHQEWYAGSSYVTGSGYIPCSSQNYFSHLTQTNDKGNLSFLASLDWIFKLGSCNSGRYYQF